MTSIQLLLAISSLSVACNADGSQRIMTFLGRLGGDDELHVTRGGFDLDARQSRWIVQIFDSHEYPLTEFYAGLAAERGIKLLAGAPYLQPNEYAQEKQPEIATYVWVPPSAFNSIWDIAIATQSNCLQVALTLTAPFRGSALNYSPGDPDGSDKIWNAERENPLLFESTDFFTSPNSRSNE